jgi:uncharacterized protein HemX
MRLAIVAVIVALLVGLGAGYLMWGERALRATDEERMRQAQQADSLQKQAEEVQETEGRVGLRARAAAAVGGSDPSGTAIRG